MIYKKFIFILVIFFYSSSVYASVKILQVPYVEQKTNYCGPASLAMLFSYYEKSISQEEVAQHIYNPKLKGTLSIDLLLFVREHNFISEIYKSDIQDLKKKIDNGCPVIVMTKGNPVKSFSIFNEYHFFIIYGYDDEKQIFYCHSGNKKSAKVKYKKLIKAWKATGYCSFLIYPNNEN